MKRSFVMFTLIINLVLSFTLAACKSETKEETRSSHKSMGTLNKEVVKCYTTVGEGLQSRVFALKALTFKQADADRQKFKELSGRVQQTMKLAGLCNLKNRWLQLKYDQGVYEGKLSGEAQVEWTRKFNIIGGLIKSANAAVDDISHALSMARMKGDIREDT